jgi:hypothetical protein
MPTGASISRRLPPGSMNTIFGIRSLLSGEFGIRQLVEIQRSARSAMSLRAAM